MYCDTENWGVAEAQGNVVIMDLTSKSFLCGLVNSLLRIAQTGGLH